MISWLLSPSSSLRSVTAWDNTQAKANGLVRKDVARVGGTGFSLLEIPQAGQETQSSTAAYLCLQHPENVSPWPDPKSSQVPKQWTQLMLQWRKAKTSCLRVRPPLHAKTEQGIVFPLWQQIFPQISRCSTDPSSPNRCSDSQKAL